MDANKAEKLAAAKKKLKQFQQKGGSKINTNADQIQLLHQQTEHDTPVALNSVSINSETNEFKADISIHKNETSSDRKREDELLHIIENLTKEKEELVTSNAISKDRIIEMEHKLKEERDLYENEKQKSCQLQQTTDQNSSIEHELRNTISILIEEKNELASSYINSKEKLEVLEVENNQQKQELDDILKTLTSLQSSSTEKCTQLESRLTELAMEFDLAKQELSEKNTLYLELTDELKEANMHNINQAAELSQKEVIIKELNLQIELLNVNMQQLKNAGPPTVDQTLEKMQKENSKLQDEISNLREQIKKLGVEKDVLAQQYQQYILRLNGQIRTITAQAEATAQEKRTAESCLESKENEITDLLAIIDGLKKEKDAIQEPSPSPAADVSSVNTEVRSDTISEILALQKKINELNLNNEELAKLAIEKESRIQELEIRNDRIQSELNIATASQSHHEREKLLQAMQSDKSTASRAIAQNRQLKSQLEELEKAFIQLSNDKLVLTEESQTVVLQNRELNEKLQIIEPELNHLRQQVEDLAGQRNATIYWKQELEEAHERIQALTHQNSELKKRVIWNLNQAPVRNCRKHRHTQEEMNEDHQNSHSSSESDGESDWVPNEEHQKLLFHYGQLEQQFQRSVATVSSLTEEKEKLDHLVLQLQSETETIGEYVSLYQEQRALLCRRAEQLEVERRKLKQRIEKLTTLLPCLAPELKKLPQWFQLQSNQHVCVEEGEHSCVDKTIATSLDTIETNVNGSEHSLDQQVAVQIVDVLLEITSGATPVREDFTKPDPFQQIKYEHLHENFHPCQVCSGRLMTV